MPLPRDSITPGELGGERGEVKEARAAAPKGAFWATHRIDVPILDGWWPPHRTLSYEQQVFLAVVELADELRRADGRLARGRGRSRCRMVRRRGGGPDRLTGHDAPPGPQGSSDEALLPWTTRSVDPHLDEALVAVHPELDGHIVIVAGGDAV